MDTDNNLSDLSQIEQIEKDCIDFVKSEKKAGMIFKKILLLKEILLLNLLSHWFII